MSQTLQQSLLFAKSMNGIISLEDGSGTIISNGQIITNGINTDTLTTNTLSVPSLSITNLNVSGTATVPTVITSDNSTNAATTAFVKNQGFVLLASNNTFSGNNTFNGATTLSGATTAPTMPVGNNSTRVATTAFVKNQNYTTLAGVQSNNNVFTGTNQFSNITYSNVSSAITLTNPDFTSPSYTNTTQLIYTGTTSSSTYSISGWTYTQDAGTLNLYINNNSIIPFYVVLGSYPTASNNAMVMQYNPTTFGNRAYCQSIGYSLIAGEYELIFYLQTNFNQSPPLSVDVVVESFGVIQGAIRNITPAKSYPDFVKYKIGFNLLTTTTCFINIFQAEGYCMYTGFSLTLTNAINVTDGTTLSSVGAKQSLLNDLYVNNSLTVGSGGIVCVGGLSSGTTFGTANTILNSVMGSNSSQINNSCISIGQGAGNRINGAVRNIIIGDYTGLNSTLTDSILIGNFQGGLGNSYSNVAIGNNIAGQGTIGENSLVGYAIGNIFQGGGIGDRNAVVGSYCFNQYNGLGTINPTYNAAVGWYSCTNCGDWFNSALGSETLYSISGNNNTLFTQYNTAVGYRAGYAFDGLNNCSFLGALADVSVANLINATAIGFNCKVGTSNTIQLGSNSELVAISGSATIGNNLTVGLDANINNNLSVNGNAYLYGDVQISGVLTTNINAIIGSNLTVNNNATVNGIAYLNGNVQIAGTTTAPTLGVNTINAQTINASIVIETSFINTTGGTTLDIGNSTHQTKLNGSTFINNNVQKLNGYSTLTGSPNNLTIPLSQYYTLTTTTNGAVTLPVITADMYGCEITFTKINATNTYTINAGTGNTFRLIGSSSSATQTSISMANNFTVLRIVATQSTIWDVLVSTNFQLVNPTLITNAATGNLSAVGVLHKYYSVTSATAYAITLPVASVAYLGVDVTFRRVGATITNAITSASNNIFPLNSVTLLNTLLAASVCQVTICCMLITSTPTYGWVVVN